MTNEANPLERFWEAVANDDDETLNHLLAAEPALATARGNDGVSAILFALYRRRAKAVAALTAARPRLDLFEAAALGDAGALRTALATTPPNARSSDGFTALHLAAYFRQATSAALLLDAGADVNAVASNAMTVSPLHSAASAAAPALVRLLLDRGAAVDSRQHGGFTPLHSAAQNGDLESLELLLERGADRTLTSDEGKTALDYARQAGRAPAVERLLGD